MAPSGVGTSGHSRPGRRFVFRETDCPVYRAQKKSLSLKAKGRSRTQLRRLRQLRDYSRLPGRRRSRSRSLPGAGRGGRFGMRRREEELERQEGCFPAQLPAEVTHTGNSLPGAAQERSRRADATLGGRAERSPGRTDRQTDGLLPPPGSAAPGSRRRAGEQRFPGPPGRLRPLPRIRALGLRGRAPPSLPLAGHREPRTHIRDVFIPPVSGAARSWGLRRGSRCSGGAGAAAGRAVRSHGRALWAAGRRPCPQAGRVTEKPFLGFISGCKV